MERKLEDENGRRLRREIREGKKIITHCYVYSADLRASVRAKRRFSPKRNFVFLYFVT